MTTFCCRHVWFCCILLYFLVINMKGFCCSNMNFAVINYVAPLLCWEMVLTFWYFRAGSENWWWRCLKQLEKVKVIPFEMTSYCWTSWTRVRQLSKCYRWVNCHYNYGVWNNVRKWKSFHSIWDSIAVEVEQEWTRVRQLPNRSQMPALAPWYWFLKQLKVKGSIH